MKTSMSLNCRFLALTISIAAITLSIMYHTATQYGEYRIESRLKDYETKILLLKRDRQANLRRLQIYSWRWQTAREDRELLSRRLNHATKELNQLKCTLRENVTESGAWCQWPFRHKHFTDNGLAAFMAKMLEGKSVASFGEGPGFYKRYLLQSGLVPIYDAYDGSPWIENATAREIKYLDLTVPQYGLPVYDWVISVEVAEHIPRDYEDIYLGNLVRHAKFGVVLSWAVPGQSGFGHVNGRSSDYVEGRLKMLCFEKNLNKTNQIRRAADLVWLKKNLMVLERRQDCSLVPEDA